MKKYILHSICMLTALSFSQQTLAKKSSGLNDMQIAHIAYTAGELDIRYAHMAMAVSDNPEVRKFASLMLRDHKAVNVSAGNLLKKLGATPQDNPTSRKLMADAANKRKELAGLTGAAFDKAYAKNELGYHQFVNKTVASTFIPAAKNKEFKKLLKSALSTFKIHEKHAKMMVKKLK